MSVGCQNRRVGGLDQPLAPEEIQQLGCRPGDTIDVAYVDKSDDPATFTHGGKQYPTRAYRTTGILKHVQLYDCCESKVRIKQNTLNLMRIYDGRANINYNKCGGTDYLREPCNNL